MERWNASQMDMCYPRVEVLGDVHMVAVDTAVVDMRLPGPVYMDILVDILAVGRLHRYNSVVHTAVVAMSNK